MEKHIIKQIHAKQINKQTQFSIYVVFYVFLGVPEIFRYHLNLNFYRVFFFSFLFFCLGFFSEVRRRKQQGNKNHSLTQHRRQKILDCA